MDPVDDEILDEAPLEDEKVVIVEKVQQDGIKEKIIFSSNGVVDVAELEALCLKVKLIIYYFLSQISVLLLLQWKYHKKVKIY